MEPEQLEYYKELAEHIFFHGITSERLAEIAKYKPNKSFDDFRKAFMQGRRDGLGKFEREIYHMAKRISEVIELDTSKPLYELTKSLKNNKQTSDLTDRVEAPAI